MPEGSDGVRPTPFQGGEHGQAGKKKGLERGSHLTHFFLFAEMVPGVGYQEGPIGSFQGSLHRCFVIQVPFNHLGPKVPEHLHLWLGHILGQRSHHILFTLQHGPGHRAALSSCRIGEEKIQKGSVRMFTKRSWLRNPITQSKTAALTTSGGIPMACKSGFQIRFLTAFSEVA